MRVLWHYAALVSCFSTPVIGIPADFLDVGQLIPDAKVRMAYFGNENFVGTRVDGYEANKCYLQQDAAQALIKIQQAAMTKGYSLWIFDCYRPQRAVNHFLRWVADLADTSTKVNYYPNLNKNQLIGEYIAEKSGHSRGSSIDLTLASRDDTGNWRPIDMGSPFDMFDPISNVGAKSISDQQRANRQLLESLMLQGGFKVYEMEWWHFSYHPPVYTDTYFDFIVR